MIPLFSPKMFGIFWLFVAPSVGKGGPYKGQRKVKQLDAIGTTSAVKGGSNYKMLNLYDT